MAIIITITTLQLVILTTKQKLGPRFVLMCNLHQQNGEIRDLDILRGTNKHKIL